MRPRPPAVPRRPRVSIPPFTFPAVVVENDTVAFLERSGQKQCDQNGDADVSDGLLASSDSASGKRSRPLPPSTHGAADRRGPTRDLERLGPRARLRARAGGARDPAREPRRHDDRRRRRRAVRDLGRRPLRRLLDARRHDPPPGARHQRAIRRLPLRSRHPHEPAGERGARRRHAERRVVHRLLRAERPLRRLRKLRVEPRRGRRELPKDIFVRDLGTARTSASVADGGGDPDGRPRTPHSDDGRCVAFGPRRRTSSARRASRQRPDIVVRDRCVADGVPVVPAHPRRSSSAERRARPNRTIHAISGDGQWVAVEHSPPRGSRTTSPASSRR